MVTLLVEAVEPPDGRDWKAGSVEGSQNIPSETAFSRQLPPCCTQKYSRGGLTNLVFKKMENSLITNLLAGKTFLNKI